MNETIETPQSTIEVETPRATPRTKPRARVEPRILPPYAVILENDSLHSFAYVIDALQRVFGYGWFKAFRLTTEAHLRGRALVWTGSLEVAEFKCERLRGLGPDIYAAHVVVIPLGCTIEPVPG